MTSPLDVDIAGNGSDLVLLHGGGGSREDLALLRSALADGRRIIAPDQRAHGRSPDPGVLSYSAMAADTSGMLDELGVRGADIVGWSDGGIVGLFVARDRPDLVRRLVAISANVSSAPPAPPAMTDTTRAFATTLTSADMPMPEARRSLPGAVAEWPAIVDKLRSMWLGEPGITLDDLATIRVPVLYLAADRDLILPEHTVAMFRATPDAQLAILADAGHELPQTRTAEVARIVERFLAAEQDAD